MMERLLLTVSRSFFNEAAETKSLHAFEPMLGNERMVEEVILGRNLATSCGCGLRSPIRRKRI